MSKHGRLDILVNNAGVAPKTLDNKKPLRSIYEDTFKVHVLGTACTTEAFISLLRRYSAARIVCISSSMGSLGLRAYQPSTSAGLEVPAYRSSNRRLIY
jgi:NAD(P)-dependent dehydrogenase (short-subunit alcohol dehydrogenase family)